MGLMTSSKKLGSVEDPQTTRSVVLTFYVYYTVTTQTRVSGAYNGQYALNKLMCLGNVMDIVPDDDLPRLERKTRL